MVKIFTVSLIIASSLLSSSLIAQSTKMNYKKTPSGLEYVIIKKGKGEKVQKGYRIYVNYTTRLKQDSVFDSNSKKNEPFAFILGQEEVLKGWDEGISLLSVGDSAHFRIPSALAYGEKKIGSIPANTILLLEIKVVKCEQAYYDLINKDTIHFPSGLKKIMISKSVGEPVKPFNCVTMKFTGYLMTTKGYKRVFQSSLTNSNLAVFQVGSGRMVKGLDEGVATMRIGEKATFIIPPAIGYGNKNSGVVPPNSTLYFDIELLSSMDPFWHSTYTDTIFGKNGIKILPVVKKQGTAISSTDVVTFDYIGYFKDSLGHPIIFDNTIERKNPAVIRPGAMAILQGFKESLIHLKTGEQAIVFVPPSMGFGDRRNGIIPPNTPLIFQVNIIETMPYPFFNTGGLDTIKYTSGLQTIVIRKGEGAVVDSGKIASTAYTGFLIDSTGAKTIFDASRESGKLLDFILGKGNVIKGYEEGVMGMQVGEGRRLIIPYSLGYGEKGMPDAGIPARSTLYFDVELVEIKKVESSNKTNRTQIK